MHTLNFAEDIILFRKRRVKTSSSYTSQDDLIYGWNNFFIKSKKNNWEKTFYPNFFPLENYLCNFFGFAPKSPKWSETSKTDFKSHH